jgi:hypothetical protein
MYVMNTGSGLPDAAFAYNENHNWGIFWNGRMQVYFIAVWYFYDHLEYFVVIWYILHPPRFGMLYQEKSGNPSLDKTCTRNKIEGWINSKIRSVCMYVCSRFQFKFNFGKLERSNELK